MTEASEQELLRRLIIPGSTGIEIGVLHGETSAFILSLGARLIGIDPIVPDSMEASLVGSVESIKQNTAAYPLFTFINDYSQNVCGMFAGGSMDFVFIDGSHHYEDVRLDYELYLPKLKSGGVMFLHDSRMYRGGPQFHPGPSKLVGEIDLELIGEAFSLTAFRK